MNNSLQPFYYDYSQKHNRSQYITHYTTPAFHVLEREIISEFEHVRHTWKTGDRLYKLAELHYSDAASWWLIALYNNKPTEAHINNGDVILIPKPVGQVLARYGY